MPSILDLFFVFFFLKQDLLKVFNFFFPNRYRRMPLENRLLAEGPAPLNEDYEEDCFSPLSLVSAIKQEIY